MGNWFRDPLDSEVSYDELKSKAENGEFHEWNFKPVMYQESGYEDVLDILKQYQASDYLKLEERYKKFKEDGNEQEANDALKAMNDMIEDVLDIYRSKNIFPIQYYSELGVLDEIQRCISFDAKFDGDTVSCVSGDTEYFNGEYWKRISEYTEGDKVLQFNADGTATLVDPIRYIHYKSNDVFYVLNRSSDLKITGNHNVVWLDDNGELHLDLLNDLFKKNLNCLLIPNGVVYDDKSCITESKNVLMRTFWAVVHNDTECMTYYNVLDDYGNVSLSVSCYKLSLKSRLELLKLFGIEYGEDLLGELRYVNNRTKSVLSTICSMSLYNSGLSYESVEYESYMLDHGMLVDLDPDEINRVNEEDKYCFTVPSHMLVLRSSEGSVFVTGNCGAGVGTGLCRWLFPNIFDTPSAHDLNKKDAETQYKKFLNDTYLRRAIKFCYSYKNGCPTPTAVEGGLRLVGSAPSNFRPMNAKAVYERFCPKGGVIYDFCAGFGGRMLGALSSKNNYRYVATDPCTETMYHLHQLGEYIEQVTGREDSYELHCCGSEEFRGPDNSIDFAFSSPPYFNLEVYSDEPTQCFNKFPELDQWLEGFVRPTIQNIKYMLKPGRYYAVNIADFKVGSGQDVAYVDEWIRISTEEGMPLFDTVYLGVTARAGSAEQAAGELKKENILVFKKPLW